MEQDLVFDPDVGGRGHVHASSIVECPNGDLLAVWYENGPKHASFEYSGDADKSDDVRIAGARFRRGQAKWDDPFVASDTFGLSDNNPALVIDSQNRLWLIHATLLAVPERAWGSSLLWYKVSSDFEKPGPPKWERERILAVRPKDLEKVVAQYARKKPASLNDPFAKRLGWMPRVHPLVLPEGTLLIPVANENLEVAAMALSSDGGDTWTFSSVVPGLQISQPSVVKGPSGKLVAFFRDESSDKRIKRSESLDGGLTWSEVKSTPLPNPGSGVEAMVLRNGHLILIYNDRKNSRDRLAVSISTDEGATWSKTRHLEDRAGGRFDYPSIIQGSDQTIHVTYSYNVKTIKHARFNEEWVMQGD